MGKPLVSSVREYAHTDTDLAPLFDDQTEFRAQSVRSSLLAVRLRIRKRSRP